MSQLSNSLYNDDNNMLNRAILIFNALYLSQHAAIILKRDYDYDVRMYNNESFQEDLNWIEDGYIDIDKSIEGDIKNIERKRLLIISMSDTFKVIPTKLLQLENIELIHIKDHNKINDLYLEENDFSEAKKDNIKYASCKEAINRLNIVKLESTTKVLSEQVDSLQVDSTNKQLNRLVTLCGRARSGKDTYAKYLSDVWGYSINHFAHSLKEGCRHFFGFNDDQLYGESKMIIDPYWGITPRLAFQLLGTELMRNSFPKLAPDANVGNNFWIKRIQKDYDSLEINQRMCIADGRFPNETEFTEKLNGLSIRIIRPGASVLSHESENYIDDLEVNYEVINDGSIIDLINKINKCLGINGQEGGFPVGGTMTHSQYIANLI